MSCPHTPLSLDCLIITCRCETQASGMFEAPLVISTCSQDWEPLVYLFSLCLWEYRTYGTSVTSPIPFFSSVQSLSRVWLFETPWTAAGQTSLPITNYWSSPKLLSIESEMPSSHLILCRPLLLLPPIPPSIRVFSNESVLHMRWPKLEFQL